GIRDATVTGVQTCALPISPSARPSPPRAAGWPSRRGATAGSARARGPPCEPCKIDGKLREAKGLLLEGATRRREAIHVPKRHEVHRRAFAARPGHVMHQEARARRIEREREQHAMGAPHAEAPNRARLDRVEGDR